MVTDIQLLPPKSKSAIYDAEKVIGDLWSEVRSHVENNGTLHGAECSLALGNFSYINTDEIMTVNLRHSLICGYVVYRVVFVCLFNMCAL